MLDLSLILFVLLLLLMGLLTFLVVLLTRSQRLSSNLLTRLLVDQMQENQSLRNQLRSPDVPSLLGLQHATLSSDKTASNEQSSMPFDLEELTRNEEELAKQGYVLGDNGGFESAGWAQPLISYEGSDPVAFESGSGL